MLFPRCVFLIDHRGKVLTQPDSCGKHGNYYIKDVDTYMAKVMHWMFSI